MSYIFYRFHVNADFLYSEKSPSFLKFLAGIEMKHLRKMY